MLIRKKFLTAIFVLFGIFMLTSQNTRAEKVKVPNIILEDQYGRVQNLESYKGKVVLINFWATWCKYCVEELPYLEKISKDMADDVVVLGIAGPKTKEAPRNQDVSRERILKFLERKKITYPILFETTGKAYRDYVIRFFPTSFIVDRDGNLNKFIPGGIPEKDLRKALEEAIQKK